VTISTTGRSGRRAGGGFTLLELLLVMMIVAVVLAAVAPSLGRFAAARTAADTAAQMAALAAYAWTQAIVEGREYRLNVDPDGRVFWLTAETDGVFDRLGREAGRDFVLPEGVTAAWVGRPAAPAESANPGLRLAGYPDEGEERDYVCFFPEGRTEAAEIRLTDRRGNSARVVSGSPTERFRVEAGEGEA